MALVDNKFKELCDAILTHGTETKGEQIRAIWTDTNEPAWTKKIFGYTARYDLQKEFPLLTLRPVNFKAAVNEILWIFQKASNNIKDLNSHIWDEWADENGSIGKAYGYQIGKKFVHHYDKNKNPVLLNQMEAVLYDLKHTPYSRRILTNIFNHEDLHKMNLQPCCYGCNFSVTDEGYDKLVLNMVLNQRSNDVIVANAWNVTQYAALLVMTATASNMIPGKLLHVIADAHIYNRHIPLAIELLRRDPYEAATVEFHPANPGDFFSYTEDDFAVINYQHHPQIKNIPVAV